MNGQDGEAVRLGIDRAGRHSETNRSELRALRADAHGQCDGFAREVVEMIDSLEPPSRVLR